MYESCLVGRKIIKFKYLFRGLKQSILPFSPNPGKRDVDTNGTNYQISIFLAHA